MSDESKSIEDQDSTNEVEESAPERPAPIRLDLSPHFSLDSSITFLNHGSFGACPQRVQHQQDDLRRQMESEPVRFFTRELPTLLDRARAELAGFVGTAPQNLAFVTNTTEAVNSVLRSLSLEGGDEILITDHSYGACVNASHFVADRAGAEVVTAELPYPVEDPAQILDAIVDRVTDRTRLALIDHITAFSGMVLPITDIVAALRERGVDTLVDGAHAPGMVDLNIDEVGAAYYAGNCHKWLCAPRGSAFLHVRSDRLDTVRPLAISHGATLETQERSRFHLEFDWTGTRDPTAWLCVPEAIRFLRTLVPEGWEGIRRRNRQLALESRRLLNDAVGAKPLYPDSMVGFTACIDLPQGDGPAPNTPFESDPLQVELFNQEGIEVPIFIILDPPRRLLRISAHLYNRPADYQKLATALSNRLHH